MRLNHHLTGRNPGQLAAHLGCNKLVGDDPKIFFCCYWGQSFNGFLDHRLLSIEGEHLFGVGGQQEVGKALGRLGADARQLAQLVHQGRDGPDRLTSHGTHPVLTPASCRS